MNVGLNEQNIMMVGITLIPPASLGDKAPSDQLTSNDLIAFSEKCQIFARLCTMFCMATSDSRVDEDTKKTWLEIFQQPLVYPLPADHPLNQTAPKPDSPPQSSPA
jgi:hypothetical protein